MATVNFIIPAYYIDESAGPGKRDCIKQSLENEDFSDCTRCGCPKCLNELGLTLVWRHEDQDNRPGFRRFKVCTQTMALKFIEDLIVQGYPGSKSWSGGD